MNAVPLPHTASENAAQRILDQVRPGLAQMEETLTVIARRDDPLLGPLLETVLPGSGKRLRPALALLIGRLGPTDPEALNHMAVGVELLHAASLIHDDVVDSSETRHSAATLFARVGNALAVLVGDYLFSQAAQECVATGNLRVVGLFAQTLSAMAQGQIDEAQAHRSSHTWRWLTREHYFRTIRGKTGALFVLACEGTALLAGLEERQVNALRLYGERLGLAFQVIDDILDFTGTADTLGKPVGSDLQQGTITLPVILLRDSGLADHALAEVFDSPDVSRQVELVQSSGAIAAGYAEAQALVDEARAALQHLPPSPERAAMEDLASYVMERRK